MKAGADTKTLFNWTDEQYLSGEYFADDGEEELSHEKKKIVTTRKEQWCVALAKGEEHSIPSGQRALYYTAIHIDDGRVSHYLCLECAGNYLAMREAFA